MKLNLLLHVGVHKTGTTTIQSFMAQNHNLLRKHGFHFPHKQSTIENKPVNLRLAIEKNDKAAYEPVIEEIIKDARSANCHTVIFSDEDFQMFAYRSIPNIEVLSQYFHVKVLMYVRRQDRYSESAYGFWVQWYNKRITDGPDQVMKVFPAVNYHQLLTFWENLFGFENVNLKVYDRIVSSGNLLEDFISELGLSVQENWTFPSRSQSNITLNRHILEFLIRTNHIPLSWDHFQKLKTFLAEQSSIKTGPRPYFLSEEQRREILRQVEHSNRQVAQRYLHQDELFPDDMPQISDEMLKDNQFNEVVRELKQSGLFEQSFFDALDLVQADV